MWLLCDMALLTFRSHATVLWCSPAVAFNTKLDVRQYQYLCTHYLYQLMSHILVLLKYSDGNYERTTYVLYLTASHWNWSHRIRIRCSLLCWLLGLIESIGGKTKNNCLPGFFSFSKEIAVVSPSYFETHVFYFCFLDSVERRREAFQLNIPLSTIST